MPIRRLMTCLVAIGALLAIPASASALTPAAPVLGGAVHNDGPVSGPTLSGAQGLAVSGNYAYVTSYWGGELTAVDVSNPASPQVVGATASSTSMMGADQVNISGNFAFVTAKNQNASTSSNDNGNGNTLTVVNISNPTNPTIVGTVHDTGKLFGAYGVAVSGHYAFVASQGLLSGQPTGPDTSRGSFSVIDLNNLAAGVVANIQNPTSGAKNNWLEHATAVAISGNYAYVTSFYNASLTVIDISNPTAPVLKASLRDTANLSFPNDVAIQGNFAYVDNQANWNANTNVPQLAVVNISNPLAPKVVGQGVSSPLLNQAYRVRIQGNFAYVSGKSGVTGSTATPSLGVIDISNPAVPRIAAAYSDNANLHAVVGVDLNSTAQDAITASPSLSTQTGGGNYPPFPAPGSGQATGTVATVRLDPAPIAVAITPSSEPANPTTSTSASFGFTTSDQVYSVQCSLDGAAMAACSTPISMSYAGLSTGSHTFTVQVTDSSGVTAQDSYTWSIQAAPQNTATPTVTGSAIVGQQLNGTPGTWTGFPTPTLSYQWKDCDQNGANCMNATGTGASSLQYTVAQSDVGSTIELVVTGSNGMGSPVLANSSPTAVVPGTSVPPQNTAPPQISGTATVGSQLNVSNPGTWTGSPAPTFTYQWEQCDPSGNNCANASGAGATTATYTIAPGDAGSTLVAMVTASNGVGSPASATSAPTAVVSSPPSNTGAAPSISGGVQAGKTLTASPGGWSGTPAPTFTYQWEHCDQSGNNCANVGSGGTTYVTQRTDLGETIRVVVTASNSAGSVNATAPPTAPITGGPVWSGLPTVTGTAAAGSTLTGHVPTLTGYPAPTVSYQWLQCDATGANCTAIPGATTTTYLIPTTMIGSTLRFQIQASNSGGTSRLQSNKTAVVLVGSSVVHPTSTQASVRRSSKGIASLTVAVKAASSGAEMTQVQIILPKGLRFASSAKRVARAVRITGPLGVKLKFQVRVKRGALLVTFRTPERLATLVMGPKALTASAQFSAKHTMKHKDVSLTLTAAGTRRSTRVQLPLRVRG